MSFQSKFLPENKIEAFCLDPHRPVAYAGTINGRLIGFSTERLEVLFEVQAHAGIIAALSYHKTLGLLACLSADNTVSVWRSSSNGSPDLVCRVPLWNLQPSNDDRPIADFQSESQALDFHTFLPRIATRAANGALLEFDLDDFGQYRYLSCLRLFRSDDLTCVRYVPGTPLLLAGSIDGRLGLVFDGAIVSDVATGGSNIHWIEPINPSEFLLASDSRRITRISLYDLQRPLVGPKFCRDDLEHVAVSADRSSAYAGSFDRKVYRIDPTTCLPQEVVFEAPFKCRWVRPLPGPSERILVQTRDGGLHIIDAGTKEILSTVRQTPSAIWTSDRRDADRLYLAGEATTVQSVTLQNGVVSEISLSLGNRHQHAYTKRLIALDDGRGCLLGRTDGTIVRILDDAVARTVNVGGAVRDICEGPSGRAFVALEDGRVLRLYLEDLTAEAEFKSPLDEPIWSIAYNGKGILAAAERSGKLRLLSASDLREVSAHSELVRPKRMKWLDSGRLLFGWSDQIRLLEFPSGHETTIIDSVGNTIEDFILHREFGYIVFISYMRNIYLARLTTGGLLCMIPDGLDYSKGLAWVTPELPTAATDDVPEFITYGRHGTLNRYKIVNEKMFPNGAICLHAAAT